MELAENVRNTFGDITVTVLVRLQIVQVTLSARKRKDQNVPIVLMENGEITAIKHVQTTAVPGV